MRKILTAVLCLVILPALTAGKCDTQGGNAPKQPNPPAPAPAATGKVPPAPDPHAGDPQPSGRDERILTVTFGGFDSRALPATIIIAGLRIEPIGVTDVMTGSQGTWTFTYNAKDPQEVHIIARANAAAYSKTGWCKIEAGRGGNDGPRYFESGKKGVSCYLTVKRG